MSHAEAAAAILPCNGSRAWASTLSAQRPFSDLQELLTASDASWASLPEIDRAEAFKSHPRIGERHAPGPATPESLSLSAAEQGQLSPGGDLQHRLAEGNRAYEETFGRVFLIRAAGRTASEILAILQERIHNTPEAELQNAAEQQRQITRLRLQHWLAEHEEHPA